VALHDHHVVLLQRFVEVPAFVSGERPDDLLGDSGEGRIGVNQFALVLRISENVNTR
jgi:hypothetical protein